MVNTIDYYVNGEKLYNRMMASVCERHDLTFMELTVLMFLANNPQYDTATEIVTYRHIAKSHVSISVRSLQERGLLHGEYRESNRRTVHLKINDSAAQIIEDGRTVQQAFRDVITDGFSQEEKQKLIEFAERIDDNVKKYSVTKTKEI